MYVGKNHGKRERTTRDLQQSFNWITKNIKCLGCFIGDNKQQIEEGDVRA